MLQPRIRPDQVANDVDHEVAAYMDAINGAGHEALSWQRRGDDPEELQEYFEAQNGFMQTANKCLEKLKMPAMELSQRSDWAAAQLRMEQACTALEKVSAKDGELSGIRGKMKKAFRTLCRNARSGKIFTSLVPTDMGGAVVSGGLNVVFTALEQKEFHREAVYKALERLPRILNNHVEYTELASEDAEMHRRTAKLYTEVLLTLEHILRWFMMDTFVAGAKRLLNPTSFSTTLSDRLAEVNLAAKDLKARGTHIMWKQVKDVSTNQKWIAYENVKMNRQLGDIDEHIRLVAARSSTYESIEAAVRDNLQPILQDVMKKSPELTADAVLQELEYDPTLIDKDMQALLQMGLPASRSRLDASRVQSMQRSPRVRAWLAVDEDSLLLINGGANNPLDTSLSFANARMLKSLLEEAPKAREALRIIPLVHFCSQHRNYYRDVNASAGGLAMSLLLQLISHYPHFSSADLQECLYRTENGGAQSTCSAFGLLAKKLPSSAVVFLIVDGVSFFTTPPKRANEMREVVSCLVDLYRQEMKATMKILLTSPTRSRALEGLFEDDEILNLPTTPAPVGGHSLLQC
ncbi:hypothetical protein JX265_006972 [Neoarthrinium moseri]|uniref:Uncharacterized protein n=1 Tax=Neoarthrinium moseri TaxID=1658444 RepID=A0A9P9WLE8_9PEZI|nr:hypothetical protein JX265_006972 [Neoarthrinium moseri]